MVPRRVLRLVGHLGIAALTVGLLGSPDLAPASVQPAPIPERRPLFTSSDIRYAATAVVMVASSTRLDHWAEDEAPENNGRFAREASRQAEHLGNPMYLASGLVLTYAAGRVLGDPKLVGGVTQIGIGLAAAGAAAGAIKLAVGRARPYETPGDADLLRPFSGQNSFPSGHATLAFALAAGIDRETTARWVPWVVYPMAAAVGWSRVRDQKHWASDVVAGAFLGTWTARKAIDWARGRRERHELSPAPARSLPPRSMREN